MIIIVRYTHVRSAKTIMEQFRWGKGTRRVNESWSGAKDLPDALRWVAEEGPKLNGFRYLGMECIDTDNIGRGIARSKDNGDTDAQIVGSKY